MANTQKRIGDRTELEFERLARDLLGYDSIRRQLGAGRQDDQGDIAGIPDTCVQVTRCTRTNLPGRLTKKLGDVTVQAERSGAVHRVVAIRLERGPWRMVVPHGDPLLEWTDVRLRALESMPLWMALVYVPELEHGACPAVNGDGWTGFTPQAWADAWCVWQQSRQGPLESPVGRLTLVRPPTYHPDPRRTGEANVGGGE